MKTLIPNKIGRLGGAAAAFAVGLAAAAGVAALPDGPATAAAAAAPGGLASLSQAEGGLASNPLLVKAMMHGGGSPLAGWSPLTATSPDLGAAMPGASEARRANALLPVAGGPVPPAPPFHLPARNTAERERALRCLATAVYFEAALESEQGQRAVAQVVLNRVRDPNFPKSVCGVVYQGWERTTGCQFSFTCDGSLLRGAVPALYRRAEAYARDALNGHVVAAVGTATHYHADYVFAHWAPSLSKIGQIGAHIFYRWPGFAGQPGAFSARYRGGELAFSEAVLTGRAGRPRLPEPDDLPVELAVDTVLVADASQPGGVVERVRGVITPGGRRRATPEDIQRINERLRAFETDGAAPAPAVPAAGAAPVPPPAAPAAESAVTDAAAVVQGDPSPAS